MRLILALAFALAALCVVPQEAGADLLPGWRTVTINDGGPIDVGGLDSTSRFTYAIAKIPKEGLRYFYLRRGVALPVKTDQGARFAPDYACRSVVNGRIVACAEYARKSSGDPPKGPVFVLEADKATPLTLDGKPFEIGDWRIEDSHGANLPCLSLYNNKERRKRLLRIDETKAIELPLPEGESNFQLDFRNREIVITTATSVWRYEKDKPVEILHEDGDTLTLPEHGSVFILKDYLVLPTGRSTRLYRLVKGRAVPIEPPDDTRFVGFFQVGATIFVMTATQINGNTAFATRLQTLNDGQLADFAPARGLNLRFGAGGDLDGGGIISGENERNQYTFFRITERSLKPLKYPPGMRVHSIGGFAGANGVMLLVVGRYDFGRLLVVRKSGFAELARTTGGVPIQAEEIDVAADEDGFYAACSIRVDFRKTASRLYYRRDP